MKSIHPNVRRAIRPGRVASSIAASIVVTLVGSACGSRPAGDSPVVILISIDTLRVDHVGIYGYERSTTPNIDAFFGEASVFENATTPAPCTVPSIRQMLSGGFDLAPERQRLPELATEAAEQWTAGFNPRTVGEAELLSLYEAAY